MAPTYTRRTRAAKLEPFTLQNAWGSEQNAATIDIQDAAWGVSEITVNADVPLTVANALPEQARSIALILSGAGGFVVTAPAVDKPYLVVNNCANAVTVKPAGGTGATIRAGVASWYYTNAAGSIGYVVDPTLDKIKAPTADVDMGGQRLTNQADGVANTDGATVGQIAPYATAAAASAGSASTSAGAAASASAAAVAAYDAFDDRYLGSKTSDPTLDNDGNALLTGAFYWNSTANQLRVRSAQGNWIAINAVANEAVLLTTQSPTAAQQGQARANIGADTLGGFRNKIINGNFEVAQRGNSVAPSNAGYTLDRWLWAWDGSGSGRTVTRVAFGPDAADSRGGAPYYATLAQTVAGSGATYNTFAQKIEDVRTFSGKKVTVTFDAKWVSGATTMPNVFLAQNFGSGGSAPAFTTVATNVLLPALMQKFSFVVDLPTLAGKTIGAGNSLALEFQLPRNAVFNILLSHVSVVEGDATAEPDPFSPRHIQQELALCQRYFQMFGGLGVTEHVGHGQCVSSTAAHFTVPLRTQMRATPSLTLGPEGDGWQVTTASGSSVSASSITLRGDSTARSISVDATVAAGLVAGNASRLFGGGSAGTQLKLDSEL